MLRLGKSSYSISRKCINQLIKNTSGSIRLSSSTFTLYNDISSSTSTITTYTSSSSSSRLYSTSTTTTSTNKKEGGEEENVKEKEVVEQQQPQQQQQQQQENSIKEEGEKIKQQEGEGQGEKKNEQQGEKKEEKVEEVLTEEERKKKKFKSNLKFGTIMSIIGGTLGFLFYESHMRHTLPYKMVMRRVNSDREARQKFGGTIAELSWYECFIKPIYGWIWIYEGGTECRAELNIPIKRYVAPPPKEGQPPKPTLLPEEEEFNAVDGGANQGYIRATLVKKSSWFYDWKIQSLHIECDDMKKGDDDVVHIVTYKPILMPTSRFD